MARSPWLCPMLGLIPPEKGLGHWVLREGQQPPEARPGCRKTLLVARRKALRIRSMRTHKDGCA